MPPPILRILPDKHIPRMRITMNKPRNKDLFRKGPNNIRDYILLTPPMTPDRLLVCHFEALDPLWYHYTLSGELVDYVGDVDLLVVYILGGGT